MLSALFTSIADALISYAIDKLDPAEKVKSWLKLEPAQLAFEKAFARGYAAFARQYPEYVASLFNDSFLKNEALPELSKLLTRNLHPDPALLAQAWGQSIGADADFTQTATKPASYFIERLEAELKAEPALQALFDSRALESLPKLEAEIQKLSTDLQRGLDTALKAASDYQKVTLHIEGDVRNSNIIIGDNNVINKYYYSGDFVSLNEYYIPPDRVFQRVRVDEFVGRDWLTANVDAFLNDPNQKSGAFLLVGDAGVGKTAFMAHLVKERRYLHLFAEQVPGQAMLQRALQSLGSQLVTRYQIDPYKDRDTLNVLAGFPDFLERLLRLAASTLTGGEKIVIVCDALDEAGVFPDHFVFGLPKELPDGVYLILSQRPVNTKLPNFEPLRFDLEAQGEDNLQDMEDYLSAVAKRPVVAGQIRAKDYAEDFFIQTLKEKSLGVWMYLHYVIKEIERGQRAPLDLESLPKGLVGYYADYWDNWRSGRKGSDATKWDVLYAPLLATLAAAQEAITVEKLIEWADLQASPSEVTRLLSESWSSFITEKEEKGKTVYTLYHQSLRDFITGKVEDIKKLPPTYASIVSDLSKKKVEAHQRIVNAFETECNGEWEKLAGQDYPRLHLTAHLNGAKEYKKLTDLLAEGDEKIKWAEAREKKEETYAGYLNDLTYVWDYAEWEQNYALAIRCMLIENSIHSLAANIPPKLLAELGKSGVWSYARCLATIQQKPVEREVFHEGKKVEALRLLAPNLPYHLHQEALDLACEIKDENTRIRALAALVPYLPNNLKSKVFSAVHEIKDKDTRARGQLAFALVSQLPEDLKSQAFSAVREIQDESNRFEALTALIPHLQGGLKLKAIQESLVAIREIQDESDRFEALAALLPHAPDNLKPQVVQESLAIAPREMMNESIQVSALTSLMPHLSDDLKLKSIQESLVYVREIRDESSRSEMLTALIPHLQDDLKLQVVQESLATALQIEDDVARGKALTALISYLPDDLKSQVIQESLAAAREIEYETDRVEALAVLAPYISDDLKLQAIQESLTAAYYPNRFLAHAVFIPFFSNDFKSQVVQEFLAVAREIEDESDRIEGLAALIPYLPDDLKLEVIQESLISTNEIKDESNRVEALSALMPYLSSNLNSQAIQACLAIVREIQNEFDRFQALAGLVPYLSDNLKSQAIQACLDVVHRTENEFGLAYSWITLAPHLTGELKLQALTAARAIKDEDDRASALADLAPYFNDELKSQVFQEALAAARAIKDEVDRVRALTALAPRFNNELKAKVLGEALTAARAIKDEDDAVYILASLAPHLNNAQAFKSELLQKALTAARAIKDEHDRANALATLAPHLNEEQKIQALSAAYEIKDDRYRASILAALAPHLNDEIQITVLQELLYIAEYKAALNTWKEIEFKGLKKHLIPFIIFISQKNREDGMKVVGALTPAFVHFSGEEIAPELYRSIMDVTRWWP